MKLFTTTRWTSWYGYFDSRCSPSEIASEQIKATGYTLAEIRKIENAFEGANYAYLEDQWMFNGLMAVLEVLDQIHENTDTQVATQSRQRFQKA